MSKIKKSLCNFTELGALAQIPLHFFVLTQKNEAKKGQDCACFAQKTCARLTKSFKLAAAQLRQERFFTPISLVFWLTSQGQMFSPNKSCYQSI